MDDPAALPTQTWDAVYVDLDVGLKGAAAVNELGEVFVWGTIPAWGGPPQPVTSPVGGIKLTPNCQGYWVWLHDGRIFSFGDAPEIADRWGIKPP